MEYTNSPHVRSLQAKYPTKQQLNMEKTKTGNVECSQQQQIKRVNFAISSFSRAAAHLKFVNQNQIQTSNYKMSNLFPNEWIFIVARRLDSKPCPYLESGHS